MQFKSEDLKTTFEVPDRPTPRDILRYDGFIDFNQQGSLYERLWPAACSLVKNYKSEVLPEAKADWLDTEEEWDMQAYEIVKWVSLAVFSYVRKFKAVEKN